MAGLRIALLSDVHGNPIALDAVLQDVVSAGGVDAYWVLGDLVAQGWDPRRVLERLLLLPGLTAVRGNTDRYLADGLPLASWHQPFTDFTAVDRGIILERSFAWTQGALATFVGPNGASWREWLGALPVAARLTLPDGTRVLASHASPGQDEKPPISPVTSEDDLRGMVHDAEADLVFAGHTHWPLDVTVTLDGGRAVRVVNLGSVSNPSGTDVSAKYVLLRADESGYSVEPRQVEYDVAAAIDALHRAGHPAADLLAPAFRGEAKPPWVK